MTTIKMSKKLSFLLTEDDAKRIERASAIAGITVSDFLRSASLRAASATLTTPHAAKKRAAIREKLRTIAATGGMRS
jgi:uncharacterized protein (DUF1778 family)